MKQEEKIAYDFLQTLGLGNPIYEPNGKIPPDFVLDNKIGIEVRRLNQNLLIDDTYQSTEELSIPFWESFRDILKSFDIDFQGKTYWVSWEINQTFNKKILKSQLKQIRESLQKFLDNRTQFLDSVELNVNEWITLIVTESIPVEQRLFRPGGGINHDESGWLIPEYLSNIKFCLDQKASKINQHKEKYPKWWLILVDYMVWGLDQDDIHDLQDGITDLLCFDKLIIIDYGKKVILEMSRKETDTLL